METKLLNSQKKSKLGRIILLIAVCVLVFLTLGARMRENRAEALAAENKKNLKAFTEHIESARQFLIGHKDPKAAATQYKEALNLYRSNDALKDNPAAAGMLIDLAACEISKPPDEKIDLLQARKHLEEAWEINGAPKDIRARAARDLGALEIFDGRLDAAEKWYRRAAALKPENAAVQNIIETLEKSKSGLTEPLSQATAAGDQNASHPPPIR